MVSNSYNSKNTWISRAFFSFLSFFFLLLMQILKSLEGQFSSFHFLTLLLKVYKWSMSFQSSGSMFHVFCPKKGTLSLPWYTDLTSGLENLEIYLNLLYQLLPFCVKVPFRIIGDRFLLSQNISVARNWMFLMWIKAEPSVYCTVVLKTMIFEACLFSYYLCGCVTSK